MSRDSRTYQQTRTAKRTATTTVSPGRRGGGGDRRASPHDYADLGDSYRDYDNSDDDSDSDDDDAPLSMLSQSPGTVSRSPGTGARTSPGYGARGDGDGPPRPAPRRTLDREAEQPSKPRKRQSIIRSTLHTAPISSILKSEEIKEKPDNSNSKLYFVLSFTLLLVLAVFAGFHSLLGKRKPFILSDAIKKLEKSSIQSDDFWAVIGSSLVNCLEDKQYPAVIMMAYTRESLSTTHHLTQSLADIVFNYNNATLSRNVFIKAAGVGDLRAVFNTIIDAGYKVITIDDVSLLKHQQRDVLHGFCDGAQSPHLDVVYILNVLVPRKMYRTVEVEEHLLSAWKSSHAEDIDHYLRPLLARITASVAFVN